MADHIEKKTTVPSYESEISVDPLNTNIEFSKDFESLKEKINSARPSIATGLSASQLENRRRLSVFSKKSMLDTMDDEKLIKYIEKNQLKLIGDDDSHCDPIKIFERNRLSIVSGKQAIEEEEDSPVPDDADPIKLVLEDQSIFYKENPICSYLKAGRGAIVSLLIFSLFFHVHGIRLFCGNFK